MHGAPLSAAPAGLVAAAICSAFWVSCARAEPAPAPLLFTEVATPASLPPAPPVPRVIRRRAVTLALDVRGSGDPADSEFGRSTILRLNLFPDVTLTARRERLDTPSRDRIVWIGRIEDSPAGSAMFAVSGGVLIGNVQAGTRSFQLRYVGDGVHTVAEVDAQSYPPEHSPQVPPGRQ